MLGLPPLAPGTRKRGGNKGWRCEVRDCAVKQMDSLSLSLSFDTRRGWRFFRHVLVKMGIVTDTIMWSLWGKGIGLDDVYSMNSSEKIAARSFIDCVLRGGLES